MKFNSDEIASVIQKEIENYAAQIDVREVGRVLEVGDGIAQVYGLSGVMAGEMVEFSSGPIGLASELRNREKVLGTTIDSRRELRIRYTEPASSPPAGVTNLDHYRDL